MPIGSLCHGSWPWSPSPSSPGTARAAHWSCKTHANYPELSLKLPCHKEYEETLQAKSLCAYEVEYVFYCVVSGIARLGESLAM